jgi:hypothetical protein
MSAPQVWLRSAIEEATGCNAYPLGVPEGAVPPYVVYSRTGTLREFVLTDALGDPAGGSSIQPLASVTVEIYRDDYVQVWETSDQVVAAIHGFAGEAEGVVITSCLVADQRDGDPVFLDGRDLPTYVVELTVEIRYEILPGE